MDTKLTFWEHRRKVVDREMKITADLARLMDNKGG